MAESIFHSAGIYKSVQFIIVTGILTQIHHVDFLRYFLISHRNLEINPRLTGHSRFHSNQYYSVSRLCTVNGRGRSIFQNLDTFNISRIDARYGVTRIGTCLTGNDYSIHYIDRLIGTV